MLKKILLTTLCLLCLCSCQLLNKDDDVGNPLPPNEDPGFEVAQTTSAYADDIDTAVRDILRYDSDEVIYDITNTICGHIPASYTPDNYPLNIEELHISFPTEEDSLQGYETDTNNGYRINRKFKCASYYVDVTLFFVYPHGSVQSRPTQQPEAGGSSIIECAVYGEKVDGILEAVGNTGMMEGQADGSWVYGNNYVVLTPTEDGAGYVLSVDYPVDFSAVHPGYESFYVGVKPDKPVTDGRTVEKDGVYLYKLPDAVTVRLFSKGEDGIMKVQMWELYCVDQGRGVFSAEYNGRTMTITNGQFSTDFTTADVPSSGSEDMYFGVASKFEITGDVESSESQEGYEHTIYYIKVSTQ